MARLPDDVAEPVAARADPLEDDRWTDTVRGPAQFLGEASGGDGRTDHDLGYSSPAVAKERIIQQEVDVGPRIRREAIGVVDVAADIANDPDDRVELVAHRELTADRIGACEEPPGSRLTQ